MAEHVDDVDVTHDEDLYLECLQVGTEMQWSFQIKTEVGNMLQVLLL